MSVEFGNAELCDTFVALGSQFSITFCETAQLRDTTIEESIHYCKNQFNQMLLSNKLDCLEDVYTSDQGQTKCKCLISSTTAT